MLIIMILKIHEKDYIAKLSKAKSIDDPLISLICLLMYFDFLLCAKHWARWREKSSRQERQALSTESKSIL